MTSNDHSLSADCQKKLNKQVNAELRASYLYLAMAQYFGNEKVALPGFNKFFEKASKEEREHAIMLMQYINKRGGKIDYMDISRPEKTEWESGREAIENTLGTEKEVLKSFLDLHETALRDNDYHLCNHLQTEFITEQIESIERLESYLTKLNRCGEGLGEFLFDKELQNGGGSVH
ncbi:unnamed protein product [Hymenolepis diminuta]|uniref:Ferritin n=1 Tax=Hymenolepis diminuta TaxID=6216 RepID=A0A564Y6P7_HYMDI|nr:unnamed protein product [Hymenolepis diminuta]